MGTSASCLNPQRQSKDKHTKCVSVFQCMSAKPAPRWAMHVGSCTAWNMVPSQTDRCLLTRLLEEEMTPSTPSSVRLGQGSTFQEPSLSTWNPLSSMRCVQEPSGSCYILSS